MLGVLNHAYTTDAQGVRLDLQFAAPDDTREAFVVGNDGSGVRVLSSTGWLDALDIAGKSLTICSGSTAQLQIALPDGARDVQGDIPFERQSDGTLRIRLEEGRQATLSWR